jgi:hypothetical protein
MVNYQSEQGMVQKGEGVVVEVLHRWRIWARLFKEERCSTVADSIHGRTKDATLTITREKKYDKTQ